MKKREFNKILRSCFKKNKLDKSLVSELPDETKQEMALFIIHKREPLLDWFITELMDMSWLNCCGYLYQTVSKKNNEMRFIHTCEQTIL